MCFYEPACFVAVLPRNNSRLSTDSLTQGRWRNSHVYFYCACDKPAMMPRPVLVVLVALNFGQYERQLPLRHRTSLHAMIA